MGASSQINVVVADTIVYSTGIRHDLIYSKRSPDTCLSYPLSMARNLLNEFSLPTIEEFWMMLESARAAGALRDKIALVTGAASGIGRSQVAMFAAAGAQVIATDCDAIGLTSLENACSAERVPISTVVADVRRAEDVAELVNSVIFRFGRVDILSNTAGVHDGYSRSLETDEDLWHRIFDVNVTAVFRVTNAVLPSMIAQRAGVILNVASVAAFIAGGGGAAYTASKHAVLGYTRQLSSDYGQRGIRVNALCPGMVETAMTKKYLSDTDSKLVKAVTSVPAGRFASPDDVAQVALFLVSDASSFMHGSAVMVDGGLTVR